MNVSVVTVSLNQRPFLERALASVLSQDYPVEYIVVDPGSTDGSREVIDRYRDRIAQVVLEPDRGPADGLNKGFRLATGEMFAYLNADDAFLPGAVREAAQFLDANPDVDVVYGDGYIVDGEGRVVRSIESTPFNSRRFSYGQVTVLQQATFFRREAFEAVGGFNDSNPTSWDGQLLAAIAANGGRLQHVPRRWGVFAIHPKSITGSNRLAAERVVYRRRVFRTLRGREWRPRDRLVMPLVRIEKWIVSPGRSLRRIWRMVVPQRPLRIACAPDGAVSVTDGAAECAR